MSGNEITHWYIGEALENARIVPCNTKQPYTVQEFGNGSWMIDMANVNVHEIDEGHPVSNKVWLQKLNVQLGDLLHLAPFSTHVLIPIPYNVSTLKHMLQFISWNLNQPIQKHHKKIAKIWIKGFFDDMSRELQKLKQNKLTWFEILGDYCAWGGGLHRSSKGIWTYIVNS